MTWRTPRVCGPVRRRALLIPRHVQTYHDRVHESGAIAIVRVLGDDIGKRLTDYICKIFGCGSVEAEFNTGSTVDITSIE